MTFRYRFSATVDLVAEQVIERLSTLLARDAGEATIEPLADGLATRGQWWYRGEYHIQPLPGQGCRILYEVHNVADPLTRWMVPLVTRNDKTRHRESFDRIVAQLRTSSQHA